MSTAVVKEIPQGAIVTVFLHSGKWFKGVESSTDENRKNKVLRLEKELLGGLTKGNVTVFVTDHDNVEAFELENER